MSGQQPHFRRQSVLHRIPAHLDRVCFAAVLHLLPRAEDEQAHSIPRCFSESNQCFVQLREEQDPGPAESVPLQQRDDVPAGEQRLWQNDLREVRSQQPLAQGSN